MKSSIASIANKWLSRSIPQQMVIFLKLITQVAFYESSNTLVILTLFHQFQLHDLQKLYSDTM